MAILQSLHLYWNFLHEQRSPPRRLEVAEERVAPRQAKNAWQAEERVAMGKRKNAWRGQAQERARPLWKVAGQRARRAGDHAVGEPGPRLPPVSPSGLCSACFFVRACLLALWCVRHQRPLKKSPPTPTPPGCDVLHLHGGTAIGWINTTHQRLCTAVKHCAPAQACLRPRVPFRPRDGDVAFQQLAVPLRWRGTSRPLGRQKPWWLHRQLQQRSHLTLNSVLKMQGCGIGVI